MLISGPRDVRGYIHPMGDGIVKTIKQQFGLVTRLSCMCVRGRAVAWREGAGDRGDGVG